MKHKLVNSRTPREQCPGYHAPTAAQSKKGGGYPSRQPALHSKNW